MATQDEAGLSWQAIAASAYRAYAASTGNKNFMGEPMPTFEALPRAIQVAWEASVRHVGACLQYGTLPEWGERLGEAEQSWGGWLPPERPDEAIFKASVLMSKRYTLSVSAEQLTVIDRACEVLSRLHAGQFDVIVDDVHDWNPRPSEETQSAYYARREQLARLLRAAEMWMTDLDMNAHHGIHSAALGDSARVAYDVVKVIRYLRWQEAGGEPAWSVYGYPPTQASQEPLPILRKEDDAEERKTT